MGLFQKTILRQYLNAVGKGEIQDAFAKFEAHFLNKKVQKELLKIKEEQYQEGFLRALFVDIFGYVLPAHPTLEANLIPELKNPKNNQKVDAGIIKGDITLGVIELKSPKTVDLNTVVGQAFGYMTQHAGCKYVIISNFRHLRFYVENQTEFEEFDLFTLEFERFTSLYVILKAENLLKDLPTEMRQRSILHRQEITMKFYNDFKQFKDMLFYDLVGLNKKIAPLVLFEKAQRIADKIVFMCFAQDRVLLPANYLYLILEECTRAKQEGEDKPLYQLFVKHFGFINKGFKSEKYDIFGYNGGLFAPDAIADKLQITDTIFSNYALNLCKYDFETDIDVNVLGHIFEHSLKETDAMQQLLASHTQGTPLPTQNKRKLDGIFYTPLYITNYIIGETLGKLCAEKQTELDWENLTVGKVQSYRNWLLTVTVLDPACGSGAFLNQVLNFFIEEHKRIDALESYLTQTRIESDIRHKILENNIFGVDINAESVAITKLSLWLRIAEGKRKLNDLSNNIKRGNSLIDDASIDALAFDWVKEFPKVMKKGGFTLVVGNPPYVDIKTIEKSFVDFFFKHYETAENRINLYSIFIERGLSLLSNKGILSFIVPNSLLVNSSYLKIRLKLLQGIEQIVKLPSDVFEEANVETITFKYRKGVNFTEAKALVFPAHAKIDKVEANEQTQWKIFKKVNWNGKFTTFNIYANDEKQSVIKKCFNNTVSLGDIAYFSLGITPYDKYKGHSEDTIKNRAFHAPKALDNTYKPLIAGEHILRYHISEQIEEYIKYGDWLGAKREEKFFTEPRIVVRQILSGKPPRIYAGYTDKPLYFTQIGFSILPKDTTFHVKYLLAIINSYLLNFIHKYKFTDVEKDIFNKILIENCKNLPIKEITLKEQRVFIDRVDKILAYHAQLHKDRQGLLGTLEGNFGMKEFSRKLENWYELDWNGFFKELEKHKIKIPLKQQKEWKAFFEDEKTNAQKSLNAIQTLENEIDVFVYALYDLSPEEVKIVENE